MTDLIRRRDAVSRMSDLLMMELQGQRLPTWNEVYQAMNDVPSVKSERKEGKLKTVGFLTCQCSECGAQFHELEYTNFCPNCGAKWSE